MKKLVTELKSLHAEGYSIESLYEVAYQAGLPLEAVEIFVNTILADMPTVELLEAQAMSDEQYAFDCLYDND